MTRIREYLDFAIRFCGLGYMVLWPLSSPDAGGRLFGAAYLCGERGFALLDLLCDAPHPLRLSPPLHVFGAVSALVVLFHLSLRVMRRRRRAQGPDIVDAATLAVRIPSLRPAAPWQNPQRPPGPVKPRPQFGLRAPQ